MTYTRRNNDQYMMRFPDGMRDEVAAAAKANGRSMNAEIIARLSGDTETLRDKFAAHALTGVLSNSENSAAGAEPTVAYLASKPLEAAEWYADLAYRIADAMLAARKAGA